MMSKRKESFMDTLVDVAASGSLLTLGNSIIGGVPTPDARARGIATTGQQAIALGSAALPARVAGATLRELKKLESL